MDSTQVRELNENCPECGKSPISGLFVLLGEFLQPKEMQAQIKKLVGVSTTVVDGKLYVLAATSCSTKGCKKSSTGVTNARTGLSKSTR